MKSSLKAERLPTCSQTLIKTDSPLKSDGMRAQVPLDFIWKKNLHLIADKNK